MPKEELSKELLDVLACPQCKGNLDYNKKEQKLICKKCELAYGIEEGIPVMLIDEAQHIE
ncbi:MAG: Trm112 family protein [archaeon]